MTKDQQIAQYMRTLHIDRKEAEELYEADREVDKMGVKEANADLSAEHKEVVKKMTTSHEHKAPKTYKFDTKTKKKDDEKVSFIANLAELLKNLGQNVEIVNENREISFNLGENSYSLTLTKHRAPKKA